MSWLPAMMFMHILNDNELDQPKQADESDDTPIVDEIRPTVIDGTPTAANNSNSTECTPIVDEIRPTVIDGTPTAANNSNSTECTPIVASRSWHYTAMSAATFALSAFLGYIATETIFKRIRNRN